MPTVQITTTIEDTFLASNNITANWGGFSGVFYHPTVYRPLVRIGNAALIPAGTITGFRFILHPNNNGHTLALYFIKDVNAWVVGTGAGSSQAGKVSHSHVLYDTQTWIAGNFSDADYDADASPPTIVTVGGGYESFTLPPAWATAWRDATRANNGFVIITLAAGSQGSFPSQEQANASHFEVDYEEAAAGCLPLSLLGVLE